VPICTTGISVRRSASGGGCGQELVDRIDCNRFPDINRYPYPVFNRPIDGRRLPGEPDRDALPPVPEGGASHHFGLGTCWEERSLHGPP